MSPEETQLEAVEKPNEEVFPNSNKEDKKRERIVELKKKLQEIERMQKFLVLIKSEMSLASYIRNKEKIPSSMDVEIESFLNDSRFANDEYILDYISKRKEMTDEGIKGDPIVLEALLEETCGMKFSQDEETISAISERLDDLQKEIHSDLFRAELELPEKRQEIISEEKEKIKETLPLVEAELPDRIIFKQKGTGFIEPAIEKKEDKFSFDGWDKLKLYPAEFASLREKYGDILAKEILLATYEEKMNTALVKFETTSEEGCINLIKKAVEAAMLKEDIKIEVEKIFGEIPGLDTKAWEQRIEKLQERKNYAQEDLLKMDMFEKSVGDKTYRLDKGALVDVLMEKEIKAKTYNFIVPSVPEESPIEKKGFLDKLFGPFIDEPKKIKVEESVPRVVDDSEINELKEKSYIPNVLSFLHKEFRSDWERFSSPTTGTVSEVLAPIRDALKEKAAVNIPNDIFLKFDVYTKLAEELE
jgi:hypothetical protein